MADDVIRGNDPFRSLTTKPWRVRCQPDNLTESLPAANRAKRDKLSFGQADHGAYLGDQIETA